MHTARRILTLATAVAVGAVSTVHAQTYPTGNDPRNGLKPGMYDAGEAAQGMRLVSFSKKPAQFDTARGLTFINSDLAFRDHYVYEGNFAGFMIWVGHIKAWKSMLTAYLFALVMFLTFEVAFDVIMPKGPLERMLGY